MGKFSLEQKIKDRLEGHEVHIDKGELWKGLGIEEDKKDRKAIWFWWFGAIGGIALFGGLLWSMQSEKDLELKPQSNAVYAVDESVSKTGNETVEFITKTEQLSAIIEEVQSAEQPNASIETEEKTAGQFLEKYKAQVQKQKQNKESIVDNSSSISNSIGVGSNQDIETKTTDFGVNSELDETLDSNWNSIDRSLTIQSIEGIPTTLSFTRDLVKIDEAINSFIQPAAVNRKFEFELFGGVGTISRDLVTDMRELDSYVSAKDSSENVLEHVSLGFSFKYKLGGGFYSKAGLSINRWNEKMSYSATSDTITSVGEVPDVILLDLQGNETVTYTEGEVFSYNVIQWIRYNRLTQIDLPLSLGYEQTLGRWSLFGEAAAIFNLHQQFRGFQYSTELGIKENPQTFKSRIGMNFGLNAGVGFGISPRIRARLSMRYYKSLDSVLNSETKIDQKYSSLGLRLGVAYQF